MVPHAPSDASGKATVSRATRAEFSVVEISDAARQETWKPGVLHPSLSWTHYRTLLRVEKPQGRAFYEIEAIKIGSQLTAITFTLTWSSITQS